MLRLSSAGIKNRSSGVNSPNMWNGLCSLLLSSNLARKEIKIELKARRPLDTQNPPKSPFKTLLIIIIIKPSAERNEDRISTGQHKLSIWIPKTSKTIREMPILHIVAKNLKGANPE